MSNDMRRTKLIDFAAKFMAEAEVEQRLEEVSKSIWELLV